jgi:glycosyltransferase involved in cell wall biosynthesis
MASFNKPKGGTELMFDELMFRLPPELKDRFSIFNYYNQADFKKKTIYWNQLSVDQEAVKWLLDPVNVSSIDHFVFVSFWQAENFRKSFNIPGFKTKVIQNACIGVEGRQQGARENVKLCYTSTPWRGLDVLLEAWERMDTSGCELHVFSSCDIYGKQFADSENPKFLDLYEKCQSLEGVVYRGSIPNHELRKELHSFDILAYPNTFEETSCIAVIEALSAGLRVVTSDLGALPETSEGWASMYPYFVDKSRHANFFASLLAEEIQSVRKGLDTSLQREIYAPRWSWDKRITQWTNFLNTLDQKES